jgi:hypothetical protein
VPKDRLVGRRMSLRTWHAGKLVILWAWGGLAAALLLTQFIGEPVRSRPLSHLFELGGSLLVLIALSIVTWRWLGGRESREPGERPGGPRRREEAGERPGGLRGDGVATHTLPHKRSEEASSRNSNQS